MPVRPAPAAEMTGDSKKQLATMRMVPATVQGPLLVVVAAVLQVLLEATHRIMPPTLPVDDQRLVEGPRPADRPVKVEDHKDEAAEDALLVVVD